MMMIMMMNNRTGQQGTEVHLQQPTNCTHISDN